MTESVLHGERVGHERRPRVGYAMAIAAAGLFAVNGTVSKVILTGGGLTTLRLTELRATGAFLALVAFLLLTRPRRLRVRRDEVPLLLLYGVVGFALVQWLYFVAIERLPIGIGLLLEFTAPVLVALWARLVWHEAVRRRVWVALALALAGLALVAEVWQDVRLDAVGVAAGLVAAGGLATVLPRRRARDRATRPRLPPLPRARRRGGLLGDRPAVVGIPVRRPRGVGRAPGAVRVRTLPSGRSASGWSSREPIVPFALSIGALRHLPATRVSIVAMLEVVLGSIVAWAWLGETLSTAQLLGGVVVLVGVVLAQTSR